MVTQEVAIVNKLGLHARPAALLVKTAGKFSSNIIFRKGNLEVNGKSIMGVMMLAAEQGAKIIIRVEGSDEKRALKAIVEIFETKFGEA